MGAVIGKNRLLPEGARTRHLLFPIIVLAHLLIIAVLLSTRSATLKRELQVARLNIINIAGPKEEKAAVEPVEKPTLIIVPEPVVELPNTSELEAGPVFDISAAAAAGFGQSCEISETLGRAFQNHATLRQALADWPPQARSVSGAIMLWDGQWVSPGSQVDPASLTLIQRGVIEGIKAAPPECLDEPMAGPRFVIVPSPDSRNTVLVLGSGAWAWRQILDYENERLRNQAPAANIQATGEAPVPVADRPEAGDRTSQLSVSRMALW